MKKIILLLAVFAFTMTSCKKEKSQEISEKCCVECTCEHTADKPTCGEECKNKCCAENSETSEMAVAYYCPMKCEGDKTYADKDVKCPVCKMKLVAQKKEELHEEHKHDSVEKH